MRGTPGYEHLEAVCSQLTLGNVVTDEDAAALRERSRLLDHDAQRFLRVAAKAKKASRRRARVARAATAKATAVYVGHLAELLLAAEPDEAQVAGELALDEVWGAWTMADLFGANWFQRQVAA